MAAKSARNRKQRSGSKKQKDTPESHDDATETDRQTPPSTAESEKSEGGKPSKKSVFASKKVVFILGALVGILAAFYTATSSTSLSNLSIDQLGDSFDAMFSDLKDRFPGGVLPRNIMHDAKQLEKEGGSFSESFAVGKHLRNDKHLKPAFPIILVPGVISTGLESWSLKGTPECNSEPYFRKRVWGTWTMLRFMLLDKPCWLQHIMLDPETGLDPPNFRVRASQGMDSADFFITGYWIWNKIIENLAALGFELNDMMVASYDWRLAYPDLERRDSYFSKLKLQIELNMHRTGKKTVLCGHSMGVQVMFYFLKWVESPQGGNGGKSWVNDYLEAFVDISGSTLGTPKAIVALLSGEMKDTVNLNAIAEYGLEQFFSRKERADMLRTFGGIASMIPKGGDALWGTLDHAPDDEPGCNVSYGNFIKFSHKVSKLSSRNLTVADSIEYMLNQGPDWFKRRTKETYSFGLAKTRQEVEANEDDPKTWSNPLEVALPNAPDLKIYCFYGVGNPTERSYYYDEDDKSELSLNVTISTTAKQPVIMGAGDGTISLTTHAMCHRWKDANSKFNPGGAKVTVVELPHKPDAFDIRGGAETAEHVDILGSSKMNELVLRVAAGDGDNIEESYHSNLKDWVYDIDLGEN